MIRQTLSAKTRSLECSAIAAGALLLATAALTPPALAQNNSSAGACAQGKQAAVAQIQQTYKVLFAGLQNQETDAQTTRAKQENDCSKTSSSVPNDCIAKAENQYKLTMKQIEDNIIDLGGSEQKAMRTVYAGVCAPSAAELAQLISSLGQAAQGAAQGAAQVISASKGKGTGSGSGGQQSQGNQSSQKAGSP